MALLANGFQMSIEKLFNRLRKHKFLIAVLLINLIVLIALLLFAFDRAGSTPFADLWSPYIDIESITIKYGNNEPYEMTQREISDFTASLRYLRVGLPVLRRRIFARGANPIYTIKTNKREYTFRIECDGRTGDNDVRSYLAYVIINGTRYNCYDRTLIRELFKMGDQHIRTMEAAE